MITIKAVCTYDCDVLIAGGGPAGSGAKVNLLGTQPIELIRLLAG